MSRSALPFLLVFGAGLGLVAIVLLVSGAAPDPAPVLLGVAAIALFLVQLAALQTVRARNGRVRDVFEAVRRVGSGEIHVFVPVHERDEVGLLGAEVNRLLDMVRARRLEEEAERQLDRAMARETPNGLVVVDVHGNVRRANAAIGRLLPFAGDPVGRRPIETIPVPELQGVLDDAARARAPCERHVTVGARDLILRAVPTADGAGCLGVVLDITSVRAAERVRRDFVANVSHELRTPITALIGYAEVLAGDRDRLPADLSPMVDAIDRNARRLADLVENVLHLSRIEARQSDLRLEPELVGPLIREVLERFSGRATQRGITIVTEPFAEVEALVNAEAFEHALSNLVDNAIKYTPPRGRVRVRVTADGEAVRVSVTDDGVGIDPVHHGRIFERFYRVDPGRDRSIGGTGLGLALVKHLCLATSSEITLVSAPDKGSTFTLSLPHA